MRLFADVRRPPVARREVVGVIGVLKLKPEASAHGQRNVWIQGSGWIREFGWIDGSYPTGRGPE
jgi:hypothetical protein